MNKCYGLYVLKSEDSLWSNVIAVSNSIEKLAVFFLHNTRYVGSYDKFNAPNMVSYSDEKVYPRYKIEELPYVC